MSRTLSIFLCLTFWVGCDKESIIETPTEDVQDGQGIANCVFIQPNDIGALEESVEQVIYNREISESYVYLTSEGETWEYTNSPLERAEYQCLHTWICEEDESEAKNYWVGREFAKTTLSSEQSQIAFGFDTYADFNGHDTKKYSDYVKINIVETQGDDSVGESENTICCVMEFLLDSRTNPNATNDELVFETSLVLNNTVFANVYSASKENYTLYFNVELGLIGYKIMDTGFTVSRVL